MQILLVYAAICAAPIALFWIFERGLHWFINGGPWERTHAAPTPPLEQLVTDLKRLEQAYRVAEASDATAKAHRMRAIGLAYDDTLRTCCEMLGLDAPERSPLSAIERLQVEADLAQHGVRW